MGSPRLQVSLRNSEFQGGLQASYVHWLAIRKGAPGSYAHDLLGEDVNVRRLSWHVVLLADQGAPWIEQQMAVAEQVAECWQAESAPSDGRYKSNPADSSARGNGNRTVKR